MKEKARKERTLLYSQKIAGSEIEETLRQIETITEHPADSGLLTALVEYEAERRWLHDKTKAQIKYSQ